MIKIRVFIKLTIYFTFQANYFNFTFIHRDFDEIYLNYNYNVNKITQWVYNCIINTYLDMYCWTYFDDNVEMFWEEFGKLEQTRIDKW